MRWVCETYSTKPIVASQLDTMKIQRVAMAMIIVFLTFYLLHLGQTLLLPLVIAGAIAYLISILAHAITKLAYKGFSVPKPLAMFVAIAIILLSLSYLIQLITVNIQSVIKVAPDYQQNLRHSFSKPTAFSAKEKSLIYASSSSNLISGPTCRASAQRFARLLAVWVLSRYT